MDQRDIEILIKNMEVQSEQKQKLNQQELKCEMNHKTTKKNPFSVFQYSKVVWMILFWVYLIVLLPATLLPIIHYFTSYFNFSSTEVALEFLFLAIGTVVFGISLWQILRKNKPTHP